MKANQNTLRRVERAQALARDLENELDNAAASIDSIIATRDQKRKNALSLSAAVKAKHPTLPKSLRNVDESLAAEIASDEETLRKELGKAQKYLDKITAIMTKMREHRFAECGFAMPCPHKPCCPPAS